MFRIVMIDDSENARIILSNLIDKILINSKIEYKIYQYESAKQCFANHKDDFDLLFLDIEMGEESGIDISKQMYEKGMKPIIVFVTSYDGYIKDAFGLNVYGYVMKEEIEEKIPVIMNKILSDLDKKSYIILNTEYGPTTLRYSDILYFMIENRKCYVKTNSDMIRFYATTLKEIKNELSEQFLYPNAKYILNALHIKSIENGAVIMSNDECIFISRGKFKIFNNEYKNFLINER